LFHHHHFHMATKQNNEATAYWMDILRWLQDGECRSMQNVLFDRKVEEYPLNPTLPLPKTAKPLLRTFWRMMKNIVQGMLIMIPQSPAHLLRMRYVVDLEMDPEDPAHATATLMCMSPSMMEYDESTATTVQLNVFYVVRNGPFGLGVSWNTLYFDYCLWHPPCGKSCASKRKYRAPPAAEDLVQYARKIHPDLPLPPDVCDNVVRRLQTMYVPRNPHYFSACVQHIYEALRPLFPEWELHHMPFGIPYITSPELRQQNQPRSIPQPGQVRFLAWCIPLLRDIPNIGHELLQRKARYRHEARLALALAMHSRVGQRSPLRRAITHSPYGAALGQILPTVCNYVDVMADYKRKRAAKRTRSDE
jgi:hypothetical protein